ncbi:divergent polysaccharide deacetylase family protein [Magnetovibrio sp. PR-2]|uniref:divergent polysaccharide deacetylase family protein n=1 Tax=Magnetovibrio sp. PR-2 TaxID=3120356 RepID=UPI002FCDE7CE
MARKTHKGKPQAKPSKAQAHAKRIAAKHRARKAADGVVGKLQSVLDVLLEKHVQIPKLDLNVPLLPLLGGVLLLGAAMGAGYGGAQALFGKDSTPTSVANNGGPHTTFDMEHAVILSEPDQHVPKTAYEEKVAEEVYTPEPEPEPVPVPEVVAEPVPVAEAEPAPEPVAQVAEVESYELALAGPRPLWLKNALDYAPPKGKPQIAIVIDDMGVDRRRSKIMWDRVPGPLTLSFMTYAKDLPQQTQAARAQGHELMLHMSMEPSSRSIDAGENVLLTAMPSGEIRSLANWGMSRFDGFVAVNNHMGSRFTEDARGMRVVLEEIQKRGLFFLDSRTSSRTVGRTVAREIGLPFLERNVFLDNANDPAKVLAQLYETERLAKKYGHAIAIGHPRDATIKVLKTWVQDAKERGFAIVPISTLMKKRLFLRQQKLKG